MEVELGVGDPSNGSNVEPATVGAEAGPMVTAEDGKVVALGLGVTPARNTVRVATAEIREGK